MIKTNKLCKQVFSVILSLLIIFMGTTFCNAAIKPENEVSPCYANIDGKSANISISGIKANCTASLRCESSMSLKIKMELQKSKSGGYETVETWTSSKTGTYLAMSESVDSQLINKGYPLELIEIMLDEEKADLIANNCYYDCANTYNYDENGELINVTNFDENGITPFGQIKTSHLSLTITTSKSGSNTVLTFSYNWKTLPANRFQDPMSLAWDSSVFSYKSGSFKKVDKYSYVLNDGSDGQVYTATQSSETSYAQGSYNYITWYADLKGYTSNVIKLYGYGALTLVPKSTGKSTQVFGHYVHNKTALSLSLSYGVGGFSVSGLSSYDELGTDISFKS